MTAWTATVSTLLVVMLLDGALGHGWITKPVSRLELGNHHWQSGMPDDDLRYCPSCCSHANACGAIGSDYAESQTQWLKFYDIAGGVPTFAAGGDIEFQIKITADHGGQSWMMLSCAGADGISEDIPWTLLERAEGDRDHHFMPSNPGIYAWALDEALDTSGDVITARWTVPHNFTCPNGFGVGRWVWKTAHKCNDVENLGRRTETFKIEEFTTVVHSFRPDAYILETCTAATEEFVTCFDFVSPTSAPFV